MVSHWKEWVWSGATLMKSCNLWSFIGLVWAIKTCGYTLSTNIWSDASTPLSRKELVPGSRHSCHSSRRSHRRRRRHGFSPMEGWWGAVEICRKSSSALRWSTFARCVTGAAVNGDPSRQRIATGWWHRVEKDGRTWLSTFLNVYVTM